MQVGVDLVITAPAYICHSEGRVSAQRRDSPVLSPGGRVMSDSHTTLTGRQRRVERLGVSSIYNYGDLPLKCDRTNGRQFLLR